MELPLALLPDHASFTDCTELVYHCIATASAHGEAISSLACVGEELYSATLGDGVRNWALPELAPLDTFAANRERRCSVKAILVEKDRIFTAHQDHRIRVWKRRALVSSEGKATHRLIATLPNFRTRLWKSLSQKNYVQVRRHHKALWIEHVDTISTLAIAKKSGVLYSASWDKTVKVWNSSTLECVESIPAHDDAVNALVVCDRSETIYTGSADGKIKAWRRGHLNVKRHSLLASLEGAHEQNASMNALALSDGGDFLYAAGSDCKMTVWGRWKTEQHVSKLIHKLEKCHAQAILCLSTSTHDGQQLLVSGSADKTIKLWQADLQSGGINCLLVLQGHSAPVKSICTVPLSRDQLVIGGAFLLYSGSADRTIKAWLVSKWRSATLDFELSAEDQ
ncbi:hypothetical protein KP509_13G024900 [Ceratopteris richardii]|uniref:Uncharacterized protein n=1 Tax=Ceratopteris richardii TaxID=49495 RepID=A0A8T2TC66_CERRI|nr:hypothetical protein KP509_13G024900 [Ceratopteris richardii]